MMIKNGIIALFVFNSSAIVCVRMFQHMPLRVRISCALPTTHVMHYQQPM